MDKNKKIMVTKSTMPPIEEFCNEIKSIWETKWLTNMGEKHIELEERLEEYLAVNNITLFTNGHLALEGALEALQLHGEVITTPFTFASTTHAIVRNGLKPVFCDINPLDCTIDANKIESLITNKTCAILPVHVYGNICDVEKIQKIAKKYNLKVIYDAAHAFGVKYKGNGIGTYGDLSMFSFHATKVFNTIEGGAVAFENSKYRQILNDYKNFGILNQDEVIFPGGNAKMNEFQASMGLCNLRHIETSIESRKIAFNRYMLRLKEIKGIRLLENHVDVIQNYSYMPIIVEDFRLSRDELKEILEKYNIFTRKYFYPLITDFECYKNQFNSDLTPIAKYIAERVLTLPLYEGLTIEEVDYICDAIKEIGNE